MFLALDTSGDWCSVALGNSDQIDFAAEKLGQGHSRRALAMLNELTDQRQVSIKNATAIVVANGPGSFTGLRIGCGLAQGLAFGLAKPIVAVGTLEVLAQRFYNAQHQPALRAPTVVLFDARMGELYGQVFSAAPDLRPLCSAFVAAPEAIVGRLAELNCLEFYAVGNAWGLNLPALDSVLSRAIGFDPLAYPRADWLLKLGMQRFLAGQTISAGQLSPHYVRDNVALNSQEQQLLREKNKRARQLEPGTL